MELDGGLLLALALLLIGIGVWAIADVWRGR